jgi:uncharacterized protein YjbI with pentapeptide repeats
MPNSFPINQRRREQPRTPHSFIPLRELLSWSDPTESKKAWEKEIKDDASDLIRITNLDLIHTRAELFFFLAAVLFVVVTTLSIADRDLLFGSHVQLPLLGLSMNFDAFLLGSPLLILAAHYALLLKFRRIRDKCRTINELINEFRDPTTAKALEMKTASNFMAQWLIVGNETYFYRQLSALIYFLSMWAAPIFTLLLLTIRTLPLHRPWLTAVQIIALSLDVALLALSHGDAKYERWRGAIAGILAWIVASLVLCVPDGRFDQIGRNIWPATVPFGSDDPRTAFAPTAFFLENGLDNATGRPILFFSRNLIVTDDQKHRGRKTPSDRQKRSDNENVSENDGVNFRGRDLRYAILDRSDLRKADFTLADLTGASLVDTDLRGATFGCTSENTNVVEILWYRLLKEKSDGTSSLVPANCTILANIKLNGSDLRDAKFVWAQERKPTLYGAQMIGAKLDGVDLSIADLSMANLAHASLINADLSGSTLIGTNLTGANLTGAMLNHAELRLAALSSTILSGSYLNNARLIAADLSRAELIGAELGQAVLYGASFRGAVLWGATPPEAEFLAWADFSGAKIEKPSTTLLDVINASLGQIPQQERNSEIVQRLNSWIKNGAEDDTTRAKNRVWTQSVRLFSRDQDDRLFRDAVSSIITDNACQDAEVALAVELWSRPGDYYDDIYAPDRTVPAPLHDPALEKVKNEKFPIPLISYGYGYPDTLSPVPPWYDMDFLINRIEKGDCPARGGLNAGVLAAMKASSKYRHSLADKSAHSGQ